MMMMSCQYTRFDDFDIDILSASPYVPSLPSRRPKQMPLLSYRQLRQKAFRLHQLSLYLLCD
jgi:hypothetical protein